jgi:hypothetical protein
LNRPDRYGAEFGCSLDSRTAISYSDPSSNRAGPLSEGSCDAPSYLSIFRGATDYYFELSPDLADNANWTSYTCCPTFNGPPSFVSPSTWSGPFTLGGDGAGGADTHSRLQRVFQDTPMHYARCSLQEPGAIETCVRRETDKLKWLPLSLPVLYGGQLRCPPTYAVMGTFIVMMCFEIIKIVVEVVMWRRGWLQDKDMEGEKPKQFSWLRLLWWLTYAFGQPLLTALVIYRGNTGDAWTLLMGLFALTPRAFSIVAAISGAWLSKGYGAQLLFIDSLIGVISWGYFNPSIRFWDTVVPPTYDGAPWYLGHFYKGIFLATMPSGILTFLYFVSGIAIPASIVLAIWLKSGAIAKLGGYVWCMWFLFAVWCMAMPFFALYELVWRIYLKASSRGRARTGERRVFPPVRWHRRLFAKVSAPHWGFRVAKHGLYWVWCAMQFVEFVGRWMAIVYLLPLLGKSFCPSKVAESAVLYVLFGFVMLFSPFVLRYFGF